MSLKKLKGIIKNNRVLYSPFWLFRSMEGIFYHLLWIFPINNKRVVFTSYFGRYYNDQPRAISDALKSNDEAEIVWLVKDPAKYSDEKVSFIKYSSLSGLIMLATARVWVDNCRKGYWLRKRKGQYYIQTWHAGIGCKQGEKDIEDFLPVNYRLNAINDSKMADCFIVNSRWCTDLIHKAFWFSGPTYEFGSPRLDSFFSNNATIDPKNYPNLDLINFKYILYGPTFRDDGYLGAYDLDYDKVLTFLQNKTGKKWKFLVRLHPNLSNNDSIVQYSENVINATKFNSLYDLLKICSIAITDYSSWMFDAGVIEKPVFLYASDYKRFTSKRGLYFDLTQMPYPFATTTDELIAQLTTFDYGLYLHVLEKFNKELGINETGKASQLTADLISQHLVK